MADNIRQWLEEIGLGKYGDVFVENEIDLDAAQHLEESDLTELGLPMGPRKKLMAAIAELTAPSLALGQIPNAAPEQAARQQAERRQLTVMFCDLVGSTALIDGIRRRHIGETEIGGQGATVRFRRPAGMGEERLQL